MPNLDYKQLSEQLAKGEWKPLYLLFGEEMFIIDDLIARFRERISAEGLVDFNLNIFYGGDADVGTIRDTIETLPMMSSRRLVIVKQVDSLKAGELESLLHLIESPVETTSVVFVGESADLRKKFFKLLSQNGIVVKVPRLYDNQLGPWINYMAKKYGKSITPEASMALRQWVGTNLSEMNNEIAKLALYIGEKTEITPEAIKNVVSRVKTDTVFELVNSMGQSDRASSFQLLANLLDGGQSEIGVLAMITRHYRILLLCQEAVKEGLTPNQIAARAGVHPFFVKDYLSQAQRQPQKHLLKVYDVLLDTDRALKSSPVSSHLWLENLVVQACVSPH